MAGLAANLKHLVLELSDKLNSESMHDVARATGLGISNLYRLKHGISNVRLDTINVLCHYFDHLPLPTYSPPARKIRQKTKDTKDFPEAPPLLPETRNLRR